MDKIELNKEQLAIIDEYCCDGMKKLKKLCDPIIMKIGGISEKDHDDIYSLAQFLLYKSVKNYDKIMQMELHLRHFFTIFLVEEFMLLISEIRTVSAEATRESVRMEK